MNSMKIGEFCDKWKVDESTVQTLLDVICGKGMIIAAGSTVTGKSTFIDNLTDLVDHDTLVIHIAELRSPWAVQELFKLAEAGETSVVSEIHSDHDVKSVVTRLKSLKLMLDDMNADALTQSEDVFSNCKNDYAIVMLDWFNRQVADRRVKTVTLNGEEIYQAPSIEE